MAFLLILSLFLILAFAPLSYILSSRLGIRTGWFALIPLAYSTLVALIAGQMGGMREAYDWKPIGTFGLAADGLSTPIFFTISLLCATISIYSMPYMKHLIGDNRREYGLYFSLLLLYSLGMIGTVLSTNLIQFYLFFELMLVPSYILIARWGYGDRERISLMYFMWTHVGALSLLAGILSIGFLSGTFDLNAISLAGKAENITILVAGAMLIGFFVKMAAFGVHIWLPHAHAEAPTPISALLSPAMIGIGGYGIVRIILPLLPSPFASLSFLISIWALITMIYGGVMALVQDDIKRMMAYSSVSQMGYILLGISTTQSLGITGSMFHYVSHAAGKGILFMVAGAIILQANGLRSIRQMGGLAARMPVTATLCLVGFLTILGVPPMSGFISEFFIFAGLFQQATKAGFLSNLLVASAAVASTALTAGYTLWTFRRIFLGPTPDTLTTVKEAPLTVTVPLLVLAVVTILAGIFPETIVGLLTQTIKQLI